MLALIDALGLDRVLLVAHDWGAYAGYLMVLRAPERFDGYLAMNINHPWQSPRAALPHLWRLAYQLPLATFGVSRAETHHVRTGDFFRPDRGWIPQRRASSPTGSATRCVPAQAGTPIEHSCSANCPAARENPKRDERRCPIRVLFGTADAVVRPSMVSPETANADDYTLETVDATHFVVDERPDLVRKKLIALAEETGDSASRRKLAQIETKDASLRLLGRESHS